MAQKKKMSSKSGGNKKKKTGTAAKKSSRAVQPKSSVHGRTVCAVVLIVLGVLSAIGYFQSKSEGGKLIGIICGLFKGLMGWGYYVLPPMLVIGGVMLLVRGDKPKAVLRSVAAVLVAVVFGSIMHLILCDESIPTGARAVKLLWSTGAALTSGGVISGGFAVLLVYLLTKVGAYIVTLLLMIMLIMAACHVELSEITDIARTRAEDSRQKRKEEKAAKAETPTENTPDEMAEENPPERPTSRRRPAIDIPLDGETVSNVPDSPEQVFKAGQPSLFEEKPKAVPPDKFVKERIAKAEPVIEFVKDEESDPEEPDNIVTDIITDERAESGVSNETKEPKTEQESEFIPPEEQEADGEAYVFPPIDLLPASGASGVPGEGSSEARLNSERLEAAFHSFGVNLSIIGYTRGPTVTRFEAELEAGTKLSRITNLEDDIALALGAAGVRIAAMPNKIATVGIEVPNKTVSTVYLRDVIDSPEFKNSSSRLTFAIGKNIAGDAVVGNIAKLPHLLVAGTTGSGKSVCLNSLILSILYKATPDEVKFIMIDPKMVEFKIYNGIPHLLVPVVTEPKKASGALQWAVVEMLKRYRYFADENARDLQGYNTIMRSREDGKTMPQIVVVIDELADLMMMAAKEVEESICRIAQMGRAAGIHLVIATQSPRADVITGLMKANIPSRIALKVSSSLESRIILDSGGSAEKLVGNGDMLYMPIGSSKPVRVQGTWVSDEEREGVIEFIKKSGDAQYAEDVIDQIEKAAEEKTKGAKQETPEESASDYDELLPQAVDVVLELGQASVSMLQRRLKLGYSRAARIVDQMEELGVVGPFEGSKPRQLLITRQQWQERQLIHGTAPLETIAPEEAPEGEAEEAPF